MRNLLKFLVRMHIIPVFAKWTSQIALTEIEAMRLAEAMGVNTDKNTLWWGELYAALCQEGFNGTLQVRMDDFIAIMGEEDKYRETWLDEPEDEEGLL